MKKILRLLGFICVFATMVSCDEPDNGLGAGENQIIATPGTNLTPTVYADQTGVSQGVSFTTVGAWSTRVTDLSSAGVSSQVSTKVSPDWISLNPTSGTAAGTYNVQISMKQNDTGRKRNAKVEFICGNTVITVTVEQKEVTESGENLGESTTGNPIQLLSPDKVTFQHIGGVELVEFNSSDDWTALVDSRAASWLSISSGSGSAGKDLRFDITAQANNSTDQRNGSITISSGDKFQTIVVTQKQKDALTVTSSKIEIPNTESSFEVEVKSNITFDVDVISSWIRRVESRGMTTSTLAFVADSNIKGDSRQGSIIIKSGNLADTVNVYQAGQGVLVISKTDYQVSDKKEQIAVEVRSSVSYAVNIPAHIDWVQEIATRSESSHTRYFEISANTTNSSRLAVLTFAATDGSGLSQDVTITQAQKDAMIVSADTIYMEKSGGSFDIEVNTNLPLKYDIQANWIRLQPNTKSLTTHNLHFLVDPNQNFERREGKIVFGQDELLQTIVVSQAPNSIETLEGEIAVPVAGTLSQVISLAELAKYTKLKITGYMNQADVNLFNGDSKGAFELMELDISGVMFEKETIDGFCYLNKLHSIKLPENLRVLGEKAFNDCILLTHIDFGKDPKLETLKGGHYRDPIYRQHWAIGAFSKCKSLKTFDLPSSVTDIEAGIFTGCVSLEAFNFPSDCKITYLGGLVFQLYNGVTFDNDTQGFFEGCDALKTITLPTSIKVLGDAAFKGWSSLERIEIPSTIVGAQTKEMFRGCKNLISVKLPSSITAVGEQMFRDCESLQTFTFAGGIKSIGDYGFYGCKSINSYPFEQLQSVGSYAFGASGITEFTAPSNLTKLPAGLFSNCQSLTKLRLGSLTEIGANCFDGCPKLESVIIPATITKIGAQAFKNCKMLSSFELTGGAIEMGEKLFSAANQDETKAPLTEFFIPAAITSVTGVDAFRGSNISKITFETGSNCRVFTGVCQGMTNLTSITIPESVVELSGFYQCENLTQVNGMQGVQILKIGAFASCERLQSITLPTSLRTIEDGVFAKTAISTLVIPEGVEVLESLSDAAYGSMPKLSKLVLPSTLKQLGTSYNGIGYCPMLYDCVINGGDLNLPHVEGLFDRSPLMSKIVISKNVRSIKGSVVSENITAVEFEEGSTCHTIAGGFTGTTPLNGLILPTSLRTIGKEAFAKSMLANLVIPNGVTIIGESAFNGSKITALDLPVSVQSIGASAFAACPKLTSFKLNGVDLSVSPKLFFNSTELKSITLGKDIRTITKNSALYGLVFDKSSVNEVVFEVGFQVKSLGDSFFRGLTNLNLVNFPLTLEVIDDYLFAGTTITLPANAFPLVTVVGVGAFDKTAGVTSLSFPKAREIKESAFSECKDLKTLNLAVVEIIESKALNSCPSMTRLDLPATLKSMGGFSLKETPLTELIVRAVDPPFQSGRSSFSDTENCTLRIPSGSVDAYKKASIWKIFTKVETIK